MASEPEKRLLVAGYEVHAEYCVRVLVCVCVCERERDSARARAAAGAGCSDERVPCAAARGQRAAGCKLRAVGADRQSCLHQWAGCCPGLLFVYMHMYLNMIFLSVCPVAALHVASARTFLTTRFLVNAAHGRTLARPPACTHTHTHTTPTLSFRFP